MIANRYKIDFGLLVERVTPTYLTGRSFRSLLRALSYPLQEVNDNFIQFAKDLHIANQVTSQKILLEKYLTNCLKKYFTNPNESFVIYHKNPITSNDFIYWYYNEDDPGCEGITPPPSHVEKYAYGVGETGVTYSYVYESGFLGSSFYVMVPGFNSSKISKDEYHAKIKSIVDRYCLASKNYKLMNKQ